MIDTNTFPSHQRLWQLFNNHHFKAVWPWDVASIGEDGEHIKQGTSHALEGTRDVDFLKEKFRSVGKMFEDRTKRQTDSMIERKDRLKSRQITNEGGENLTNPVSVRIQPFR